MATSGPGRHSHQDGKRVVAEMMAFKQTGCPGGDAASPARRRNLFASVPALALMLLAGTAVADFEDGWDAYQSGEFGIAYSEWLPLAEAGHSGAQLNIGVMYRKGEGVPQDPERALHWFSRAAGSGDGAAHYNIGILYRDGIGVEKDEVVALDWIRRSAEHGNTFGQLQLGLARLHGRSVEQDMTSGILLINKAAESGNAHAAYELAKIYQHGCAITEENAEAVRWFERAALARHARAAFAVGLIYSEGCGIPVDRQRGLAWLTVAHRRGLADAGARAATLGETLDGSQVDAARELARSLLSGTDPSMAESGADTPPPVDRQPEVQMAAPDQADDQDAS